MTAQPLLPPMPYAGGKQREAQRIAGLFPDHDQYVEPFGGGLSVLLAKRPSRLEIVNDLNRDLMTFWSVLRDRADELERACAMTPHSRAELAASLDLTDLDDVERARRVWVQLTQARGARLGARSGWRFVYATNAMPLSKYLHGYLQRIAPAAERLRWVALECRDALDVIDTYGQDGTLMYVDPPYPLSVRHGVQYAQEFGTDDQHTALLDALVATPARVVLSGYDSPLYADRLDGWQRHTMAARAMTGTGRTEVVWTNFHADDRLDVDG